MDTIVQYIRTVAEAQELITQLDAFKTTLYSVKDPVLQDYFSHLPKELADTVIDALRKESSTGNKSALENFILQLEEHIRSCNKVEMTLAFQPDDATISLFSTWIKKELGATFLLEIHTSVVVVGGAIIVVNGQYKDYSVKKKLAQVFQIQKEELLGMISHAQ